MTAAVAVTGAGLVFLAGIGTGILAGAVAALCRQAALAVLRTVRSLR